MEGTIPSQPARLESTTPDWLMWLSFAARMFLGVLFLIYGAEKLTNVADFAHNIYNYRILPLPLVNIAALLFIWTEITVGILLIAGAAVRGSALVTGAMLVTFIIAILAAMARGLEIDCGCTAGSNEKVGWLKVFEDLGLLAVAIFLVYYPKSFLTIDRLLKREGREEARA